MRKLWLLCALAILPGCPSPNPPNPPPDQSYDCDNPPQFAGVVLVADHVPNEYIIVFKGRGVTASWQATNLTAKFSTLRNVRPLSVGIEAMTDAVTAARVAQEPSVAYVQQMGRKKAVVTWGLDRIDQRDLPLDGGYTPDSHGSGIHAYIGDTGIDSNHSEFAGRLGECFTVQAGGCADGFGHGTHVSSTVAGTRLGVANLATIHAVRVLDSQGSGTDADVIRGIDWVTQHVIDNGWPAVMNMSLGGGASPAIDQAVCRSIAAGVVHVVAAGNESGNACDGSPARVKQALTLGASDRNDRTAIFSNYGPCVDVYGPGVDVEGARRGGGSETLSGTSMASPHGAGTAILCLEQNPGTPAQVAQCVLSRATDSTLNDVPAETPNLLLYVK